MNFFECLGGELRAVKERRASLRFWKKHGKEIAKIDLGPILISEAHVIADRFRRKMGQASRL